MPISNVELSNEKIKLYQTKVWIDNELKTISQNDMELEERIKELKKQSRGSYSEELETAQKLYEITHKNLKSYSEAKTQPYFARIDFREYKREVEQFYIGKFGLGDSKTGDEIVIDWRAPLADLYYSGTQGDSYYEAPIGIINGELFLKRKFLIKDGELIDAFDEGINEIILKSVTEESAQNTLVDEFLRINLEGSVSSKLKDVVATIQKEQNNIIRAEKNSSIIVQGAAGSGKTTVALHRLAYLLYKFKNKIAPNDVLVLAPNKLFLDYISEVLPNLGVENVIQKTMEDLSLEILGIKSKVLTKDKKLAYILENDHDEEIRFIKNSSRLKGTPAFKKILDRYLIILESKDLEVGDITVDGYTLFDKKELHRLYSKDLINLPINKRKDEIKRYLGMKLNEKVVSILDKIDFAFEYNIARSKKTMEDSAERRKLLTEIYNERDEKKENIRINSKKAFDRYFSDWTKLDTRDLYYNLFMDKELFSVVTSDKIPTELITYIVSQIENNISKGIVDADDLAPMMYLKFKIEGVPDKFKFQHIVVDEAQDYSILQFHIIKEMAISDSCTIVGDIGQGIYTYKGVNQWDKLISEVFPESARYMPLTQSYRSTIEIIEVANKVLKKQNNNLVEAVPVLRHGKKPEIIEYKKNTEFVQRLDLIVEEVKQSGKRSVAVVGRNYAECKKIRDLIRKESKFEWEIIKDNDSNLQLNNLIIPSYMTKGLEFDCAVIYNCSDKNYMNNDVDQKLLYVALTRALHFEYIFYNGNISELLSEVYY